MKRNRAWRRHQTERVIEKRLQIVKIWCSGSSEVGSRTSFVRTPEYRSPGILKKWNLTCGCGYCKINREKGYYHEKEKKKSVSLDREYGDLYFGVDYNS